VMSFFYLCLDASYLYDFMIISPEGKIIGESVINEIDNDLRSANFRICLFHPTDYGKGIGTWALEKTRDFAFQELHLHRLELNVFSFNVRAIKAYKHAGFRQEGILKDAIKDGDKYADNILMAILEDEWKSCK
ncbi:MAG: GNAT family N-acetyltransferase, partial [Coprobacillus cateniformis]|uniref:GNAT family N-acetyltransferase n=1 Tax=Coprobacillus cateniformis TaxID=100884 RepID=UPI0039913046